MEVNADDPNFEDLRNNADKINNLEDELDNDAYDTEKRENIQ